MRKDLMQTIWMTTNIQLTSCAFVGSNWHRSKSSSSQNYIFYSISAYQDDSSRAKLALTDIKSCINFMHNFSLEFYRMVVSSCGFDNYN